MGIVALGASTVLREDKDRPLPPAKRDEHERTVAAARRALGEETFEASWFTCKSL